MITIPTSPIVRVDTNPTSISEFLEVAQQHNGKNEKLRELCDIWANNEYSGMPADVWTKYQIKVRSAELWRELIARDLIWNEKIKHIQFVFRCDEE